MKTESQVKVEIAKIGGRIVGQRRKLIEVLNALIDAQETQGEYVDRDSLDDALEIIFQVMLRTSNLSPRHAAANRRRY